MVKGDYTSTYNWGAPSRIKFQRFLGPIFEQNSPGYGCRFARLGGMHEHLCHHCQASGYALTIFFSGENLLETRGPLAFSILTKSHCQFGLKSSQLCFFWGGRFVKHSNLSKIRCGEVALWKFSLELQPCGETRQDAMVEGSKKTITLER